MRSRNSIQLAAFSAFLLLAVVGRSFGQDQIQWLEDLDQAKAIAARDGKLLLVHFWSERCGPCKNLDTFVFPRPDVARVVHQHCIPVKVNTDENRGLTASMQIDRIPQDVFMLPDGKVVAQQISPSKANHYIQLVSAVADRASSGSPSQGMNGLTAGRARVAGLQSSSDSVPVVSASEFGAPTPGQGIGGKAPSIQVTDRMDPTQNAAALSENYANNFGQPQGGYDVGSNPQQPTQSSQPSYTNPYVAAASASHSAERDPSASYANAARPHQGLATSPAAQERTAELPRGNAPQIPPYQAATGAGISLPGSPATPSAPPTQTGSSLAGPAGANRPASATENPLASNEAPYGAQRASNQARSPQSPSTTDWQGRQTNNGLALPPIGARSGGEVAQSTGSNQPSPAIGQSGAERQYADPSRFAVNPRRQDIVTPFGDRKNTDEAAHERAELALPPDALREYKRRQIEGVGGQFAPERDLQTDGQQELSSSGNQSPTYSPNASPAQPPRQANVLARDHSQDANPAGDGEPELALDGYCPITLVEHRTWQRGKKEYGCIHRGKLYLFFNAADRDRFLQFPDRFAPMLSGYDPVIFADRKELVEGKREHGVFAGGRVYMFASEETLNQFYSRVDHYTAITHQAMGLPVAPTLTAQGNQSEVQR